jgi:uncharacterized membrane protein YfcA
LDIAHAVRNPDSMMEILIEWTAIAAIGAAIGFAGGLFGVGGGMLAVPVLALGFGLDQQFAQGTTYVMAAPTAVLGLWHYHRHGSLDRRYAFGIALTGCIAGYLGTLLALYLDPQQLRRVFSIFLLLLIAYMVISELPRFAPRAQRKLVDMRWSPVFACAVDRLPADVARLRCQAYIMDTNEEERAKGKTVEARPRSFAPAAHAQQRCAV